MLKFNQVAPSVTIRDPANQADDGFTFIKPLLATDFTGDGLDDLIVGGPGSQDAGSPGLYFLRSNGDGTFDDVTKKTVGEQLFFQDPTVVEGDFDGDGENDFIVYSRGPGNGTGQFVGEIPVLLKGEGDGTFEEVGS